MKPSNTNSVLEPFVKLIIIAVLAVVVLSYITHSLITAGHPDFLSVMLDSAKESREVSSKIGGFTASEYTFNENDLNKDNLKYQVIIKGEDGYLKLSGYATKKNGEWIPNKIDSVYTIY